MKILILILSIPTFMFSISPTLVSYDSSHIVLSFPCIQNSTSYNIYRLPFISKRRDAKPRLYDKLFLTEPQEMCIYEDWYPFNLTERIEEYLEYIITPVGPDGFSEGSFLEGYNNRLRLQKAKADFSIASENFCPETSINFINSSTGLVSEIMWYLGNEIIGDSEEISYSFSEPGNYEIKLEAIGPIGISSITKEVEIHTPPEPKIEGEHYACQSTIIYTDEGMTDYKWYYEGQEIEGANSNSLNITNEGIYNVSYRDQNGCFGISEEFEFLHFKEPEAIFEVSAIEVPAGEFLYFTNSSRGENLEYFWEFGDGEVSIEENPVYVYRKTGNYNVRLTIKDICGRTDIYQKEINVLPGQFDISKDSGTIAGGTPVIITGQNFPQNPKVYIDNKICQIISSSQNQIEVLTPSHSGGFEYYDIEIKDENNNLLYKMNKMFRFINFGFIGFEASNKVSLIDMDKKVFYGWDIEIQNPKALYLEGKYAYIGGKGVLLKFNSGTGEVEKSLNLDLEDYVFSITEEEGLYGKYIFASVYNPEKNPKGKIIILNEDLNIIAYSDFKGSIDGAGLEFEKAKGKVYLLANGPISDSENQEHKKKMIINIYNPMSEFEEEDGIFYLPIMKILSKDKDSQVSYFNGSIAKTEDGNRIFYGDPISQNIIEINTDTDSFKGPDIETTNNPISMISVNEGGQNILLSISYENSILEVYNLPENGKKNLQSSISLLDYGCPQPKYITRYQDKLIISCSNNKIIFLNQSNFNLEEEFTIESSQIPSKIKIQKIEEVGK